MGVVVHGTVAPGFEPVARAFRENFEQRGELGASVAVYRHGEVVVDLWGGEADAATHRPWERDTTAVMFSATKGLCAIAFLMLEARGQLDVDQEVAHYWPGFARNGKATVTVRQLLNHRAGLCAVDQKLSVLDFRDDLAKVDAALEAQEPLWAPGTAQGYGATAWGMYAGALFRRITGESVGTWLRREVFEPLGADVHLGLPAEENARVATLYPVSTRTIVLTLVPEILRGHTVEGRVYKQMLLERASATHRAFFNPDLGKRRLNALNDPEIRAIELPWMDAVGNARSVARVYSALVAPGDRPLVPASAVARVAEKQSWSNLDRVMGKPLGFSQGFQKEEPHIVSPHEASFGHLGAGGSVGWADPSRGLAFGYVMNRMDHRLRSPRSVALCRAIYEAVDGWV